MVVVNDTLIGVDERKTTSTAGSALSRSTRLASTSPAKTQAPNARRTSVPRPLTASARGDFHRRVVELTTDSSQSAGQPLWAANDEASEQEVVNRDAGRGVDDSFGDRRLVWWAPSSLLGAHNSLAYCDRCDAEGVGDPVDCLDDRSDLVGT